MMKRLMSLAMRSLGRRTCEDVVTVLHEYLDGSLDPELAEIIERHLKDCPECQAFTRTYETVVQLTGELLVDEIPDEVCLRVRQALRERAAATGTETTRDS